MADRPQSPQGVLLVTMFVSMPLCVMVPLSVMEPQPVMVSLLVAAVAWVLECALVSVAVLAS